MRLTAMSEKVGSEYPIVDPNKSLLAKLVRPRLLTKLT